MSLAAFFHWIQSTGWATDIRESALEYPIIMSLHLSAIAVFGGMILMTNLRLLGLALTDTAATDMVKGLRPWKYAGFVLMVTCGVLLASSKADTYYANPYFRVKMLLLAMLGVHALYFRNRVYRDPSNATPGNAKLAACLSLVLWIGVMSMGRWIAYFEPDKTTAPSAQLEVR
jgi:hypothetical protein